MVNKRVGFWSNPENVKLLNTHWGDVAQKRERFLVELREVLKPGMRVLDLGCGTGKMFPFLSEIVGSKNVYGVDQSEQMLDIARKHYPDIKTDIADAIKLPYEKNTFDVVIIYCVLMHRPDCYRNIIKSAIRVCKKTILMNEVITKDREPTQGRLPKNRNKYPENLPYWAAYNEREIRSAFHSCDVKSFISISLKKERLGFGEGYYTIIRADV